MKVGQGSLGGLEPGSEMVQDCCEWKCGVYEGEIVADNWPALKLVDQTRMVLTGRWEGPWEKAALQKGGPFKERGVSCLVA